MTSYPIIDQQPLRKASRRGPMGMMPPRREASELPLPNPHEAVVYKAGGSYFVDDGRTRASDDPIVNATSFTVIDMREGAPVPVHATIPSAGATHFVVQVTFLCTVRKPEEVVEAGLKDIAPALTNYLIQHQPLFHLGEDYGLEQVTIVRRNVTSEVKAYFNVRPPRLRGLEVELGNVQVSTPEELRAKQQERELKGLLTSEQQQLEHDLAQQKAELDAVRRRSEEEFELERRRHEQELALLRQQLTRVEEQFLQQQEQQKLTHEQRIRTASFQHAADEADRLKDALGAGDSEMPTIFTAASGARGIAETVDSLNTDRERRREQEADDKLRRDEWSREDQRESARMQYNLEVERLKAQAEVAVAAVRRGLADHQNIEEVLSEIKSVARQLEQASTGGTRREEEGAPQGPQGPQGPEQPARPERRPAAAGRAAGPDSDGVFDAQVIPSDPEPTPDLEPREEDLGR